MNFSAADFNVYIGKVNIGRYFLSRISQFDIDTF
jgi:hypothetical protein